MATRHPDPNYHKSRIYPRTLSGVQWTALLSVLKRGLEVSPEDDEDAMVVREEILEELQKDVDIYPELEALGWGLTHPDRRTK